MLIEVEVNESIQGRKCQDKNQSKCRYSVTNPNNMIAATLKYSHLVPGCTARECWHNPGRSRCCRPVPSTGARYPASTRRSYNHSVIAAVHANIKSNTTRVVRQRSHRDCSWFRVERKQKQDTDRTHCSTALT